MFAVPSLPLSVRRGIRRGVLRAVREQGWGASFGTIFGILLLAQCAVLAVAGLEGSLILLREKTDIRLEISESASDVQIQDFIQSVRSLPIIDDVTYITREQAYERMRQRDPAFVELLGTFGIQNPFPETVGVRLRRLQDFDAFVHFLRQPVFAAVVDPTFLSTTTDQEQQVRALASATETAHAAALLGIGILAIILVFVMIEFIRRRALGRRDELYIEQLVGASRGAMLTPFFAEILVLLLLSLAASLVTATLCVWLLPLVLPGFSPEGLFGLWISASRGVLLRLAPLIVLIEILGVILLAFLATTFALKDQLTMLRSPLAPVSDV